MSEQALLVQKYVKIMAKHPGKWLAVYHDEVVGVAGDLDTLLHKVKDFKGVFVAYSPTPEEQRQAYLI